MSILILWLLLLPSGIGEASGEVVEKVTVTISADQKPPARIIKRMVASVGTVGEQMLVGREHSEIVKNKASYEKLIQEIFDRVLVGYSVQTVKLVPGVNTMIQVELTPWGGVVQEAAVEIDFGNMSPEIKALVKKDIGNIEEQVNEILVGLPVDAVDWAGGVAKIAIREAMTNQLPEFQVNFDIVSGTRTVVKLSFSPMGATVQDVRVSLRSRTIPNLLLMTVRPTVEQTGKNLVGLPIRFIERHQGYFTNKLGLDAGQHPMAKGYGLTFTPIIHAGTDTEIDLDVETDQYKVAVEGYLEMGRRQDDTSFRLHAGKFIGKKDEVFTEVNFIPSSVTWNVTAGWGHSVLHGTTLGIKYNISDQQEVLWLNQTLNRSLNLRLERAPAKGENEFAIRYKMHDFLSVEYIMTQDDRWLRLISNL